MTVSIDDIIHKEFSRSLMGYDMQEVDVFLDTVIERIEKMEGERAELIAAMEKLLKRVERLEKAKENRALTDGESAQKKPAVTAGPVRVQGGKARPEAEERTPRRKRPAAVEQPAPQAPVAEMPHVETPYVETPYVETPYGETPAYTAPAPVPQPPFAGSAAQTEPQPPFAAYAPQPAPAEARQPQTAATQAYQNIVRTQTAQSFATDTPAPQPVAPPLPAVAVEMETGLLIDDDGEIIPELISDIESALLDGSIRSASRVDAPVRAADKTRVS